MAASERVSEPFRFERLIYIGINKRDYKMVKWEEKIDIICV